MSDNLQVVIYVVVSVFLLFWIGIPLMRKGRGISSGPDAMEAEATQSLFGALRKLRAEQKSGKLAEDDYANIEQRLLLNLARSLQQQGIEPDGQAKGACPSCSAPVADDHHFCGRCGHQLAHVESQHAA